MRATKQPTSLEREIANRAARGLRPSTIAYIRDRLAAIGYKMDRSMDCFSNTRHMTGDFAGQSYPAITTDIAELDTGISFAHYKDARRDANFRELQRLRYEGELFAVVRGRILEL